MEDHMAELKCMKLIGSRRCRSISVWVAGILLLCLGGLCTADQAGSTPCPVDVQPIRSYPGISVSEPHEIANGYLFSFNIIPGTTFNDSQFAFKIVNQTGQKLPLAGWPSLHKSFISADMGKSNIEGSLVIESNSFLNFVNGLAAEQSVSIARFLFGNTEIELTFYVTKAAKLIQGIKLQNSDGTTHDFLQQDAEGLHFQLPVSEAQAFRNGSPQGELFELHIEAVEVLKSPWNLQLKGVLLEASKEFTLIQKSPNSTSFILQYPRQALRSAPRVVTIQFTADFGAQRETISATVELAALKPLVGSLTLYLLLTGVAVAVALIFYMLYKNNRLPFSLFGSRRRSSKRGEIGSDSNLSSAPASVHQQSRSSFQESQSGNERIRELLDRQQDSHEKFREHSTLIRNIDEKVSDLSKELTHLREHLAVLTKKQEFLYPIVDHQRCEFREIWMVLRDWEEHLSHTCPESEILTLIHSTRAYWGRLVESGGYRESDTNMPSALTKLLIGAKGEENDPYLIYARFLLSFSSSSTDKVPMVLTQEIQRDPKTAIFLKKLGIYYKELTIGKPLAEQVGSLEIAEMLEILPPQAGHHLNVKVIITYPFWVSNLSWSKPNRIAKGIIQMDIPS
jgi:hypothetical protein